MPKRQIEILLLTAVSALCVSILSEWNEAASARGGGGFRGGGGGFDGGRGVDAGPNRGGSGSGYSNLGTSAVPSRASNYNAPRVSDEVLHSAASQNYS
ncbi:hypothetical protein BH10CYA1_BH10CYA1_40530 [soil metagenome]